MRYNWYCYYCKIGDKIIDYNMIIYDNIKSIRGRKMFTIENKVVLITGALGGIGSES